MARQPGKQRVLKAYYAHCVALYNTPCEARDIKLLKDLGFEVINPNNPECTKGYKKHGMGYFRRFAKECDLIAFRALADGSIPAGVAEEIFMFRCEGKPVIEIPTGIVRRSRTVEQTREYLCEVSVR